MKLVYTKWDWTDTRSNTWKNSKFQFGQRGPFAGHPDQSTFRSNFSESRSRSNFSQSRSRNNLRAHFRAQFSSSRLVLHEFSDVQFNLTLCGLSLTSRKPTSRGHRVTEVKFFTSRYLFLLFVASIFHVGIGCVFCSRLLYTKKQGSLDCPFVKVFSRETV